MIVNAKVVACSGEKFLIHCDARAPSCSIDSCLSLSDLSLVAVSGSLGRQFVGVKEILKIEINVSWDR